MRAVIMAGGVGTRLRPLTCDIPKPMARLCGRPMMEYILDLLEQHQIQQAAVTLRYLPSAISEYFGENYRGVSLQYIVEEQPLGTAGSVKGAVEKFHGDDSDILIISGDALTDFDLTSAYDYHKKNGAAATLVVTRVEDPREYGLVRADEKGRVIGFVEKPGWAQAVTDCANTGIYILSPSVLSHIPKDTAFDFAKDLFPLLLEKGIPLYAFETSGYWCDIGNLATYISCQRDILEGRLSTIPAPEGGVLYQDQPPQGSYIIIPPAYIGRDVSIGLGAQIGPFAVLDDGCRVGDGAKIRNSVMLNSSYSGDRTSLTGTLLCHGASVRRGASLFEGSAIGSGGVVGEYATIFPEVKVWPNKKVEDNRVLRENLREGNGTNVMFDDAGLTGETGVELTPEFCARIGSAAGSIAHGEKVAIGCSHDKAAASLKMAVASGILSTGGVVWDFGACIEPQFDFFVNFGRIHTGVYVGGGPKSCIRLTSAGGLPASRNIERSIETRLATGDFSRVGWNNIREVTDMSGMRQLYRQELISMAPTGLSGVSATVRGSDYQSTRLLSSVLATLGCDPNGEMRLHLGAGGRRLSLYDSDSGYIWPEQTLALGCLIELENGNDIALPFDAPVAIEMIAEQYGHRIKRYLTCPANDCDADARLLASGQLWARDGLMMAVKILYYMKQNNVNLSEMVKRLPSFAVATKTIACDVNPGRVLRRLSDQGEGGDGEGTRIRTKNGTLLVRPSKRGSNLILTAEAADTEIADELCGELEQKLNIVFLDIAGETK
ncbi:MAG: sugar phosphate nucleotidyltransferase [Oscillospiraceae bacterium]|nr:sugar phosphate nucleotidyltransferase [Oscillospiraceae bacterium]MDD4546702.1 sugar phosphate nucleotidyltransferase [Oscillospiraceae bacterium]